MATDTESFMLTTIDNPWNPYTNWDEWYAFDQAKGYDTTGFLARIATNSNDLSDADQAIAVQEAIDEIVKYNVRGIYKKITKDG
jgi:hypothetical protein